MRQANLPPIGPQFVQQYKFPRPHSIIEERIAVAKDADAIRPRRGLLGHPSMSR